MIDCIEAKKRTGRTSRLFEVARKACEDGLYVFVVAPSHVAAKSMQREFESSLHAPPESANGKTYWSGGQISWESCESNGWDWRRMRFLGSHPTCVTLVDPSCVELHFGSLLWAWQRFDSDVEEVEL
jgi:hypothetical protein